MTVMHPREGADACLSARPLSHDLAPGSWFPRCAALRRSAAQPQAGQPDPSPRLLRQPDDLRLQPVAITNIHARRLQLDVLWRHAALISPAD